MHGEQSSKAKHAPSANEVKRMLALLVIIPFAVCVV